MTIEFHFPGQLTARFIDPRGSTVTTAREREIARLLSVATPAELRRVADLMESGAASTSAIDEQIWRTEPRPRRVVRFGHRFEPGGKVFHYVAVRIDGTRQEPTRRWYVSTSDAASRRTTRSQQPNPHLLVSPCTWVELVRFAEAATLEIAPAQAHWRPVSNLPAGLDVERRNEEARAATLALRLQ